MFSMITELMNYGQQTVRAADTLVKVSRLLYRPRIVYP